MTEPLTVLDYQRLAEAALEPGAFGHYAGDERALVVADHHAGDGLVDVMDGRDVWLDRRLD